VMSSNKDTLVYFHEHVTESWRNGIIQEIKDMDAHAVNEADGSLRVTTSNKNRQSVLSFLTNEMKRGTLRLMNYK
jgi:hypothetical protein